MDPKNNATSSVGGVTTGHAAVAVMTTTFVQALTVLLTGFHGLSQDRASAAAYIITAVIGSVYLFVAWFLKWKYPSAPPIPNAP